MSDHHQPWEPDPAKLGNWQSMFEQQRRPGNLPPQLHTDPAIVARDEEDDLLNLDAHEYRPWILQRGRSPGTMMLALRWFDAKAGLWHGSAVAYPSLYAIDSIGTRMVSLDFGARQFVVEGRGLDALAQHLQQGIVLAITEYNVALWPGPAPAAMVTAIRRIAGSDAVR